MDNPQVEMEALLQSSNRDIGRAGTSMPEKMAWVGYTPIALTGAQFNAHLAVGF